MVLKGQPKKDYQREYMRDWRRNRAERTKVARSNAVGMGLLDPVKTIVDKVLSLARECIEEGTFVYSKPEEFK